MTGNLKSLANLPVNPLTCQLVNLKFRQRVEHYKYVQNMNIIAS